MQNWTSEDRAVVLSLLQDVAESEHRLRRPAAFDSVCAALGFEVSAGVSRIEVRDAQQPVQTA